MESIMKDSLHPQKKKFGIWRAVFLFLGLFGTVCFLIPMRANVYNIGGILGFVFSLCLLGGSCFLPKIAERFSPTVKRRARLAFGLCMALLFLWAGALSGCMVYGALNSPAADTEYTVVILGSKVNGTSPSADLWQRILAAEEYLKAHPQAKAVASGGKGEGEDISEAEAIRNALVDRGIEESRIYLEDRSSNTQENLSFSMEIIRENGLSQKVALVTDEYHQFRAGRIAASLGVESAAVCARTPWYIFPACWARELLALSKFCIFG